MKKAGVERGREEVFFYERKLLVFCFLFFGEGGEIFRGVCVF